MSPKFCERCGKTLTAKKVDDRERLVCDGCGFVRYDNPLPVVAAIVEHGDDVLLVRNKGWPEKWYGLMTGFLERDETPEAGVLRELREELGLDGEVVSLIGVYAFPERNELIVGYHVRARGEIRVGPELEDFKRVPVAKLRPWPFGTGHVVAKWLEGRSVG
jgi:NAD+ diphosphatase